MKKTDKNIIILTALGIVGVVLWTMSSYSTSKKDSENQKGSAIKEEIAQENQEKQREEDLRNEAEIANIPSIPATKLHQKNNSAENITIIDLRTAEAFEAGHVRGSKHIQTVDLSQLDREIYLVSSGGINDAILNLYNQYSQSKKITFLENGIRDWKKYGLPLIEVNSKPSFTTNGKVHYIEPRDLITVIAQEDSENLFILDTRRDGNYTKGHIPGAVNIPLSETEQRFREIPKNKKIFVYGADTDTSFQSGVILYDLQHLNTKTINGGFAAWKEFGYPTATE